MGPKARLFSPRSLAFGVSAGAIMSPSPSLPAGRPAVLRSQEAYDARWPPRRA